MENFDRIEVGNWVKISSSFETNGPIATDQIFVVTEKKTDLQGNEAVKLHNFSGDVYPENIDPIHVDAASLTKLGFVRKDTMLEKYTAANFIVRYHLGDNPKLEYVLLNLDKTESSVKFPNWRYIHDLQNDVDELNGFRKE